MLRTLCVEALRGLCSTKGDPMGASWRGLRLSPEVEQASRQPHGRGELNGARASATGGRRSWGAWAPGGVPERPDSSGRAVPRAVGSLGSCELEHGVLVTGRPLPTAHGLELGGGGGRPLASSHGGPCRSDHPKV